MSAGAPKYAACIALLLLSTIGVGASLLVPRVPHGAAAAGPAPATARIDLNTASADELEALPRIGPALARRIVADREEHGPFKSIDDLDRVPGIGPKTLELLRPFARVTLPPQHEQDSGGSGRYK